MQIRTIHYFGVLFVPLFILGALVLSVVSAPSVRAACDPKTEQQVSIGFPGAVEKDGVYCVPLNKGSANVTQNPIWTLLKGILQVLAGGVGMAVVGGLIWGGFLIMNAQGNSSQVQNGIEIIRNAVIGLLLFIFMFAIINFIIPGGILS